MELWVIEFFFYRNFFELRIVKIGRKRLEVFVDGSFEGLNLEFSR